MIVVMPGLLEAEDVNDTGDMALFQFWSCKFLDAFGPMHKGAEADIVVFDFDKMQCKVWLMPRGPEESNEPDHIIPMKLVAVP